MSSLGIHFVSSSIFNSKIEILFCVKFDYKLLVHLFIFLNALWRKKKSLRPVVGCHFATTDHSFHLFIQQTMERLKVIQKAKRIRLSKENKRH